MDIYFKNSARFHACMTNHVLWFFLLLLVFATPATAQNLSSAHRCQIFERELLDISRNTRFTPAQAKRYHQLAQYQQQAGQDAIKFACYSKKGIKNTFSDECFYITNAQQRINSALEQLSSKAASPQQRQMRQALYQDMQRYQCRHPQELRKLLRDNRPLRVRKKQIYKKPKPVVQSALQRPKLPPKPKITKQDIIKQDYVSEEMKAQYAPSKPAFEHFVNPAPEQKKAAENNTPPPALSEPIDYVPNSNIRRVGPVHFPDQ